jgi:hypothetical protein
MTSGTDGQGPRGGQQGDDWAYRRGAGTGRSVAWAVIDTMAVGARVDLVGVAHGGMDHQVDPVGVGRY